MKLFIVILVIIGALLAILALRRLLSWWADRFMEENLPSKKERVKKRREE